jgi:hypothetical protein
MKDKLFSLFNRAPVLIIVMSVLGLALGFGAFSFTRAFVATSTILQFEGIPLPDFNTDGPQAGLTPQPGETAAPPETGGIPSVQLPEPWDGTSRVTVLGLGWITPTGRQTPR